MSELSENEHAEDAEHEFPQDKEEPDDWPSSPEEVSHERSLADGAGMSFGLSLVALLSIVAHQQVALFLRGQDEPTAGVSISAAALIAVTLLISVPSWIAAVVFALGSLLTIQRHWFLAVLALLVSVASASMSLLAD